VTLCSGEPLLVRDIGKYARQLRDAGKTPILNTNGSLLRRIYQGLNIMFDGVGLPLSLTAECLIIDPDSNLIQPHGEGHRQLGNCLRESINSIWARAAFAETVQQTKHWLSMVPQ